MINIRKEEFVEIINDIKSVNNYSNGLNNYFKKHNVDGYLIQPDCTSAVIKLLHILFDKTPNEELIDYFIFELDFGSKWKSGTIKGNDGLDIKLSTAEELYDYLISE